MDTESSVLREKCAEQIRKEMAAVEISSKIGAHTRAKIYEPHHNNNVKLTFPPREETTTAQPNNNGTRKREKTEHLIDVNAGSGLMLKQTQPGEKKQHYNRRKTLLVETNANTETTTKLISIDVKPESVSMMEQTQTSQTKQQSISRQTLLEYRTSMKGEGSRIIQTVRRHTISKYNKLKFTINQQNKRRTQRTIGDKTGHPTAGGAKAHQWKGLPLGLAKAFRAAEEPKDWQKPFFGRQRPEADTLNNIKTNLQA